MSRGMKIATGLLVAIPIVAIAIVALNAPREESKDYRFPRVVIDATINPDGSLQLDERRTFAFRGSFTFATFEVDWPSHLIEGFTVSEGGQGLLAAPVPEGDGITSTWTFSAQDEERTFRIRYRALCAVDVYRDAAHLLWQFVGTGWDKPTDRLLVRVHVPPAARRPPPRPEVACPSGVAGGELKTRPLAADEIRAWGHGPLAGEVRIVDPQTVELEVRDLRPFALVEGSILMPSEVVPFAPIEDGETRASILAEERRLAEEADALRRQLLAEQERLATRRLILFVLLSGLALAFVVLVVVSRIRDRVPGLPPILREPPEEIHPVDLAQMWAAANGRLAMREVYRTQMLHLARIGAIELQPIGRVTDPEDFHVELRDVKEAEPRDMEFLEFLFPDAKDDREGLALSSLKPTGTRRRELRQWWNLVDASGKKALARLVPSARWESLTTTVLGLVGAVVAMFAVPFVESPIGLLLLPVSLVGMAIAHALIRPRLGAKFRERIARWRAFRHFLERFSTLPEAPALAVIVWEHYLVLATALGVADEVEKQVKALVPPQELPRPWAGAPSGVEGFAIMRSFGTVPVHTAASVTASSSSSSSGIGSFSSSSGGGGGFSSGGGGGGGGTGGGAG